MRLYLAGLSVGSRRTMRDALRLIARLVEGDATEMTLRWQDLDYGHASAVRAALAERFAPATCNKALSAMRGVLRTAFRLSMMGADRMARACAIQPVRGSRVQKGRAVPADELRRLFESCDPSTPAGARDAAALALLYGSGLRRAELVTLDLSDFDAATGALLIRGKGNKERRAFMTGRARAALEAWIARRGDAPGPLLLPVTRAGSVLARRMSGQAVADVVSRVVRRAMVGFLTPHDLRRSFIGDLLDAGADIVTVQALAGHADPRTTSRYDRRGDRAKRRAVELLHVPYAGVR